MKTMKTVVAVVFSLVAELCSAATYYVDSTRGSDENSGTEAEPFASIATALAQEDVTEVVLAAGDYAPAATIELGKAVVVRGATGNPADVRVSGGAHKAFSLDNASAVLRDLVVENCTLNSINQDGVAVYVGKGVVSNCVVRNCKMLNTTGRGTLRLNSASAYAYNCVVSNNYMNGGNSGGGNSYGAGIGITKGTAVNCLVCDNSVSSANLVNGAGVYISEGTLANSTVVNNRGNANGGVYVDGSSVKVVNCLILGNSADGAGGSVQTDIWGGKSAAFDHCIARAAINNKCFAAADWPIADGAFTPLAATVAHDAGAETSGFDMPPFDVLGNPRQIGEAIDIGAVENQGDKQLVAMTVSERSLLGSGEVTFTAWTQGLDVIGYTWDFGDGTVDTDSGRVATHDFKVLGTFPIRLTVHTASGVRTCAVANTVTVAPKTLFVVKGNAGAAAPYATIETAAPDVATALASASAGQEVVIAPETYLIGANLNVASAVKLRGATGNPADVVLKANHTSQFIRLAAAGSGLYDLTVDGNSKSVGADGILLRIENHGTVSNCVLRNANGGAYASHGAVYLTGADALLTHCVVSNCTTTGSGYKNSYAGVKLESSAKVSNCLIAKNTFSTKYDSTVAGVYVNGGSLVNCTIVGNTGKKIGGVRCSSGSVVNCAVVGNVSQDLGDDYANVNKGDDSRFSNCASDVKAIAGTDCKFNSDKSAIFAGYADGNYAPASGSILRENGKDVANAPALDLAGNPRVVGEKIDIGAYEADLSKLEVKLNVSSSDAFVPATIVLTAVADGAEGATYEWTFGDGQTDTTSEPVVTNTYWVAGDFTASVKLTKGTDEVEDSAVLHIVPKIMRVMGSNKNAAFPYDTVDNAASNINQALEVAIADSVIEVEPGTVREKKHVRVENRVTIRGRTGCPGDVIVIGGGSGNALTDDWNFDLANSRARFESLTLKSPAGRHVRIDQAGGTVSNCVVCGTAIEAACFNHSDEGVVTHCTFTNVVLDVNGGGGMSLKGVYACDKHGARLSNTLFAGCSANTCGTSYDTRPSGIIDAWGTVEFCTVANCKMVKSEMPHVLFHNLYEEKSVTPCGKLRACVFGANKIGNELGLAIVRCKGATIENCVGDFAVNGLSRVATAEELFRRPAKGDWRLRANSPARDIIPKAEQPADLPATDLGGNPRVYSVGLDAGCYECLSGGTMLLVR